MIEKDIKTTDRCAIVFFAVETSVVDWERGAKLCEDACETFRGTDGLHYHAYLPDVGRGSPNGSGQSSLLHEEFRGECSTPATLETLGHSSDDK
jgi:hypothetical protein